MAAKKTNTTLHITSPADTGYPSVMNTLILIFAWSNGIDLVWSMAQLDLILLRLNILKE